MTPVVLGSAAVAAIHARPGASRRWAVAAATATGVSAALTGVLIGTVNLPLLSDTVAPDQRSGLAGRWHRVNKVRLLFLVCAGGAWERAARQERSR